jgi:hypothetical protein
MKEERKAGIRAMNPGDRRKKRQRPAAHSNGRDEMRWGIASGGYGRFKDSGAREKKN